MILKINRNQYESQIIMLPSVGQLKSWNVKFTSAEIQ